MFADESLLISTDRDHVKASVNLETDLLAVTKYFSKLKLYLNVGKTKLMDLYTF